MQVNITRGGKRKTFTLKWCTFCKRKTKHPQEKCWNNSSNKNRKDFPKDFNLNGGRTPFKKLRFQVDKKPQPDQVDFCCMMQMCDDVVIMSTINAQEWYLDTAASRHITCNSRYRSNQRYVKRVINWGNRANGSFTSEPEGDLLLMVFDKDGKQQSFKVQNVSYFPTIGVNIISAGILISNGFSIIMTSNYAAIKKGSMEVCELEKTSDNLWKIKAEVTEPKRKWSSDTLLVAKMDDCTLWHNRLAHLGSTSFLKMERKHLVEGLPELKEEQMDLDCKSCAVIKATDTSQSLYPRFHSQPIQLIYSDVYGPQRCKSKKKNVYFATFVDDHSRYVFVRFLASRSEVFKNLCGVVERLENNHSPLRVQVLRTDGAGEYTSDEVKDYAFRKAIVLDPNVHHTPQMNGFAERLNRTLNEKADTILHFAGLDYSFWDESVATATYLYNMTVHSTVDATPFELFFKQKPYIGHMKTFECLCYAKIPSSIQKKMPGGKREPKAELSLFMGYNETHRKCKVWNLRIQRFLFKRAVVFHENKFLRDINGPTPTPEPPSKYDDDDSSDEENEQEEEKDEDKTCDQKQKTESQQESGKVNENGTESAVNSDFLKAPTGDDNERPKRKRTPVQKPGFYKYFDGKELETDPGIFYLNMMLEDDHFESMMISQTDSGPVEPTSFEEIRGTRYEDDWTKTLEAEYESIMKNKTWRFVRRPRDRKVIQSKVVCRIKRNPDNSIQRFKCRVVAKGFSQIQGLDYYLTYAPVARIQTVRLLLYLVVYFKMEYQQMDVDTAFLYADLPEDQKVYMEIPKDLYNLESLRQRIFTMELNKDFVVILDKTLYGLKQSQREWNSLITRVMTSIGLKQSKVDNCLFFKVEGSRIVVLVIIYVDDILIAISRNEDMRFIKTKLKMSFKMKDMGDLNFFLRMEVTYNQKEGFLQLSQVGYAERILERFNMTKAKPVATPLALGVNLDAEDTDLDHQFPNREAVGSLMYLMLGTRPDLCFSIGVLSRYLDKPRKVHVIAVKRVLRYLRGTT